MNFLINLQKIMASAVSDKVKEKRSRVLLGQLPDDFLRINMSVQQQQEAADRQAAMALQQQYVGSQAYVTNPVGRLNITIVQARLAKNYGMTRMDPYARIRVGHFVQETNTDPNGGKNPRWNKVMECYVPPGINKVTLEIFDERSFTVDELIAWTEISIPQQVLAGQTHDEWYTLNGKQGDGLEGTVNIVLSYSPPTPYMYPAPPTMVVPRLDGTTAKPLTVFTAPPAPNPVSVLSESELKQIEEMFPNIDKEVIKTVYEVKRGNKDGTINSLLQMAE